MSETTWMAAVIAALVGATGALAAIRHVPLLRRWDTRRRTREERSTYLRGVNYILSNDTDAAIEELTKVARLNSDVVETYFALGTLFRTKGEVERAIRIHQTLIGRPDLDEHTRTQALYELGLDYKKAGLIERARTTLAEVLERDASFTDAYRALEQLFEEMREWEKAYEMQEQVVRRTGEPAQRVLSHLMVEIGRDHEARGDLRQARHCYRKALALEPGSAHASIALGALAMREGQPEEAIALYRRAMRVNPGTAGLFYPRLAEAYDRLGDPARYENLLRQQVVHDEADVFARLALAQLLARRGRTRDAIEELRRALEQKPDFVEARKELGRILLASGSVEEVRREYEDLLAALVRPMKSFQCAQCGFETPEMEWKCPQCQRWDTIGYKRFRRQRRSRLRVA